MSSVIHLLGIPALDRADAVRPRGKKTWAVLAYLVLADERPGRQGVAELLFPDADDPLGALRWTLADLRRVLGEGVDLGGDPLHLVLPPGATVDIQVLSRGTWVEAVGLPTLGRELLEGLSYPGSPTFELWLASERRRLGAAAEAVLREAVLASLAHGAAARALDHASRLVRLNPYDENHHVLLVRSLSITDGREAAMRQVDISTELLRRELGLETGPILRAAAATEPVGTGPTEAPATVMARLEAGEAAVGAGALETGLASIRRAVAGARTGDDRVLLARSLLALGSTLVHAARGTDEEGAAALYEGRTLADLLGDAGLGATARRELAWVEFLRGRYDHALAWSAEAERLAIDDDAELAWAKLITGACQTDRGDYRSALPALIAAVELAERAGTPRTAAVAGMGLGRLHLLRGDTAAARPALERSFERARGDGWTAFLPMPESLLAEIDLRTGDVDRAEAAFEHAFALGCQVGDPCWESVAARGLGLVHAARGDKPSALAWLEEATRRCRRLPDAWLWLEGYALDALCTVAVGIRAPGAPRWIAELEAIASRAGMRELLARAMLHRARLGDPGARAAAGALAARIDNPALAIDLATVD